MGWTFTKKKTLKDGRCLVSVYYWGFWFSHLFLMVDMEQILASGCEIQQVLNARLHYSSTSDV